MSNLSSATEKRTLVEEGTTFKGSMSSTCPVLVKGGIEGDVQAPSLTVAGSGTVSGKVKAGELKSEGSLAGEFDVEKIQLSGSVKDNTIIRAKSLEVKLSSTAGKMQVVFGETELEVGEQPTREKAAAKDAKEGDKSDNGKSVPPPAES
ncbi:MAG: polymer-forming cytoskeletal protein [Labilithrix sp.]|nr:polymer-forming cytoskeletal protein [Labilithrix sp.]MCW5817397.1 polymer-forming cytoskeletal protein [Labilithrix sp.]